MQRWRPDGNDQNRCSNPSSLFLPRNTDGLTKRGFCSYQLQTGCRQTSPLQQGCHWGSAQAWTPAAAPRRRAGAGWRSGRRTLGGRQGWCSQRPSGRTRESESERMRGRTSVRNSFRWGGRCPHLRGASHPHHGHDGRTQAQGLLQAAFQQAEVFELSINQSRRVGSNQERAKAGKRTVIQIKAHRV